MNVIACTFTFRRNYGNSTQLGEKSDMEKQNIYIKNVIVTLTSAKLKNPEDEVLWITDQEPPAGYKEQLEHEGVKVAVIPFDHYVMPEKYPWALAFFKLCALTWLSKQKYEKILLIDADTYTVEAYKDLWEEMEYGLMLYPVNHTFRHITRTEIREDAVSLGWGETGNVIHYGGEFVGARRQDLVEFLRLCETVCDRIREKNYAVHDNFGDETVIAIASMLYKKEHPLTEAGAYIYRYWTERYFYLVSTNTIYNPVCIWHMPAEKDKGLLMLYRYYRKHGHYPDKKKAAHLLGICPAKRPSNLVALRGRIMRKMSNLRASRKK